MRPGMRRRSKPPRMMRVFKTATTMTGGTRRQALPPRTSSLISFLRMAANVTTIMAFVAQTMRRICKRYRIVWTAVSIPDGMGVISTTIRKIYGTRIHALYPKRRDTFSLYSIQVNCKSARTEGIILTGHVFVDQIISNENDGVDEDGLNQDEDAGDDRRQTHLEINVESGGARNDHTRDCVDDKQSKGKDDEEQRFWKNEANEDLPKVSMNQSVACLKGGASAVSVHEERVC